MLSILCESPDIVYIASIAESSVFLANPVELCEGSFAWAVGASLILWPYILQVGSTAPPNSTLSHTFKDLGQDADRTYILPPLAR